LRNQLKNLAIDHSYKIESLQAQKDKLSRELKEFTGV